MKALTPAPLTRATVLFAYSALPSPRPTLNSPGLPFRPQPRDPSDSRFLSRLSAIGHSRLRHYPAGSPRVHAETGSCSYRLAVRLQLLPTTPLGGAVTFGYKVTTYSDRDFHPADKASSRTHWMAGSSPAMTTVVAAASARLKPQHRLGDDVALDLVGAAVDRDLAVVEIARRDLRGPVHGLVRAVVAMHVVGCGERPDHLHQKFGRGLLDLRALDLQDRGRRIGLALAVLAFIGDDAELRQLQRLQLDLDGGELLAKTRILDHRLAAGLDLGGELLDAADALLGDADAGNAGALVAEQELGVIPALVLLAHQVLDRHLDVVEEDLVDLMAAVDGLDRPHRDALALHVDQDEGDAGLLLRRRIGAAEAEDHVGVLRQRCPGLLAVDDIFVALALGLGLERGEVGAGAGLGEALAPPVVDVGDARQILLLLRLVAKGVDDGTDHADAEGERRRRRVHLQLLVENVVLHRGPPGAAIFLGPVRDAPALVVEDAPPGDHLVLRQMPALDQFAPGLRRHVIPEERPHVLAERHFFLAESEIHRILLWSNLLAFVIPGRALARTRTLDVITSGFLRRLLLTQFVAREFSDRGARQRLDEFERDGQFVLAELAGQMGAQLVQRERVSALAQLDEGLGCLAAVSVGNPDHDHLVHGGVGIDRLLDHLRIDVEAAGDDHVLLAVDQKEIAVTVHIADVAGQEAVADEGLGGLLRSIPIAFGDVRSPDADFADLARAEHLGRILQRHHVHLDAGQHQPDRAGLVRPLLGMAGARRAGLGHAPAALQLHADLALEDLCDLHRQRRAAGAAGDQRGQVASVEIGQAGDRDPHRWDAGKGGGALDLDVAHHRFDIEALMQRDQMAAPDRAQENNGEREDVEQRQYADHAFDRIVALGARGPAPDVIDRYRRGEVAVAEHGAFRQPGGAAGILQQRDVIGRNLRPLRRAHGALDKPPPGDDRRVIRQRRLLCADPAPMVVLADDQPVE